MNISSFNFLFPLSIITLAINCIGIIQYGLTTYRFGGIFLNANQSGRLCYFMFIAVLMAFNSTDYNIFKKFKLYTYFFLICTFFLTVFSNSRLFVILSIVHLLFYLASSFLKLNNNFVLKQFYINLIHLKINKILLITLIIILMSLFIGLFDSLFEKLAGNSYLMQLNNDYTNGRILLWQLGLSFVINNIGFLKRTARLMAVE